MIRRIRVRYHLKLPAGKEDVARRVHDVHREKCPVYRTLAGCVDVTTELETEAEDG